MKYNQRPGVNPLQWVLRRLQFGKHFFGNQYYIDMARTMGTLKKYLFLKDDIYEHSQT